MSTINSYIRKQALAFLCVFLFCLSMGYSQNLMQSRKEGYLTYVVQLSNVQTKQYVDNPYTFPYEEVLKTVLDSFPSDSTYKRKLIPGNYLFLNAWENTLQVRLQLVCDFEVKAFTDTKGLAVEVLDKNGKNLSDATLNLPKQLIPYSSSRHCYALAKPKEIGSLTVEYGPCISFYRAEENNPYSFWKRRLYKLRYSFPVRLIRRSVYRIGRLFRDRNLDDEEGQPQRKEKAGYMDFSKPKYLPGDTVKFKAYLVNKRGKPLNKPLTLHLQHEYSFEGSKPLLVRTLKPLSPGAYAGSFPLGDTLTLDKNYSIYLLNQKGNTFYFSGRFRYEDYQLDETTYGANLNKSEFTAADTVMLTVSGKDANGLPLLDGHYSISLTRNAIDHIYSDSIYASDTLWIHQGFLENTAETKILIPQTLFPDLKAGYTLRVLFNNSNFESHTEILELTVDKRKEILNLTASDSVITGKARGEQLLGDSYTLTALSPEGDTLLNHPVQVPFREVSNPLAATYILSCKHQDVREEITADKHDPVSVRTHRSKDSVFFQLDNPHRVLVTWAVYRNQHLIQHGQGRDLHWTQPDQSQDSYFLQYSCLWAGRRFEERSSSICFEHNLNIVIHQPETVYPGQEVKMDVQVSDYKGHPAKNVNLTGSSVNSLFKDVRLPAVPYFGKRKKGIPAHKTYELNPVTSSAHALFLSAALRQRMKLDTIAWYKAVYPATGLGMKLDSIGEDWAQFAPFVFRNGIQQQVYAIHIDGKLVYWHIGSIKQPYSFIDWPGWHTVTLRLRDTTFRIDSVRLQNHFKTNLTLDLAKANPHVKFRADTNILSYREGEEVEQNILCLKGLSTGSTYFIRQGTKIVRVDPSAYNAYRGELIYTGPFRPGQELEFIKQDEYTLHFLFESGYSYETRKDLVKMRDLIGAQTNHKLWTGQTLEINFADKALSEKDIEPFSKPAPYNPFVKTYALPTTNKAGNGAFSYRYAGDSLLYAVVMTSLREGNT
ncbi:MAG TPA: hypothetical protein VNZ86_16980, partial [Bacteroidia bacterium]|nr:hypothetical protein [Bacteroidia bacterium]